jgi:hypothetical protein
MLNTNTAEGGTKETADDKGPAAAPSISLPKGGGAIRGVGEKFAANPVTGTGSMSVPIYASPGRSGFGPQLAVSYDSGAGNGPFGLGWSLSLPQISRKTDKGLPRYDDGSDSDVFMLSGAEDLVPLLRENAQGQLVFHEDDRPINGFTYRVRRYRPRIEGLFARIERWTRLSDGDTHWRSISKDNITTLYGKVAESRIFDPSDPTRVFSWLICQSHDDKGNAMLYEYTPENSDGIDLSQAHEANRSAPPGSPDLRSVNRYLKRIQYGNETSLLATGQPILPLGPDLSQTKWRFEVVFDYGEGHYEATPLDAEKRQFVRARAQALAGQWLVRSDPFSSYRAGFEVRAYRLCRRVLMFHHFVAELGIEDCLVRSTEFRYTEGPVASFVTDVIQSGYVRQPVQGQPDRYLQKSLPSLQFEYSQVPTPVQLAAQPIRDVDSDSMENLPSGLDGSSCQWVDLDGEGLPGFLTEQADAWFYKRNLSPVNSVPDNGSTHLEAQFAPTELVASKPEVSLAGNAQFLDLAGDGQPDLVMMDGPVRGFYERTEDEDWETFRTFVSWPNVDTRDPNLKFIDLDGDGHSDILMTEDDAFTWYPSLAEDGFGPALRTRQSWDEEKGPRLVFADVEQSIYLADLSGDGLTDLVRIRNGEVCYWPNLGYGNFGAKVTMDHAPYFDSPDQFDQRRIRLADTDGSGTTDILYLRRDGVRIYFNQAGNSWSEVVTLLQFPVTDNFSSIQAVDLLGNGTACLVWSSPLLVHTQRPMRYIDLMGQKPHLLIKTVNNLGAETVVHYASSTKFYLQDKRDGKPWITKLPFPVHVVERVETYDRISRNRFVTRYAYHHGYFDGPEREFRGFGAVKQWDTEEIGSVPPDATSSETTNLDAASFVPPILTKTWFHTGAFIEEGRISRQFEKDYYRESDLSESLSGLTDEQLHAMLLEDTVLPDTVLLPNGKRVNYAPSAEEIREACRALKGSILRQEIYALDNTDQADRPYSASERNYSIEILQPRGGNPHAVFFVHPRETVDFHYERKLYEVGGQQLADPRVTHSLTLAVDEYGNILRSAAVAYGRRHPDPGLTLGDQARQQHSHVTFTENRFTVAVLDDDAYRSPLRYESRTCELLNPSPLNPPDLPVSGVTNFFRFEKLNAIIDTVDDGNHDLLYEDWNANENSLPGPRRRVIEHVRALYRNDDLTGPSPLGEVESLALPFETYKLAFTANLAEQIFVVGSKNPLKPTSAELAGLLSNESRYVHWKADANSQADTHWWIPSGRVFFSPDATDTPAQELDAARQHFFLPRRFRNPFDQDTRVRYDTNDLLLVETRDPLDNVVTVETKDDQNQSRVCIDYRVLQADWITDPNGNRSRVAFDALGLVVGTAVMGKPGEHKGDFLDNFKADLYQSEIDDFFDAADPHVPALDLLKQASTRIIYDLHRFQNTASSASPQPAFATTLARETHANDPPPSDGLKIQISFSYSDGFGRELQKKIQAEPESVIEGEPVTPRWVGSGWTIFNNKGKAVRQYEPFFSQLPARRHHFEFGVQVGVSPILLYDPVERIVATIHPNHVWEKVVFDPWRQESWDVNDTVLLDPKTDKDVQGLFSRLPNQDYMPTWHGLRTDPAFAPDFALLWPDQALRDAETDAVKKAAKHAGTSALAFFDSLGSTFLTVAHNRRPPHATESGGDKDEFYSTRIVFDIEGNQREVIDAKGRVVMRYDYDMLRNRIHQASMEAGERWMLNDITGKPNHAWDSRGFHRQRTYDSLRRPTGLIVNGNGLNDVLAGKTVYGDDPQEGPQNPEATNHRGKVYQVYDSAGLVTSVDYDFKGNPLSSTRQLIQNYNEQLNWNQNPAPEDEVFTSSTRFDALNRVIQQLVPHSNRAGTKFNIIQPTYNEANLLEKLDVWLQQDSLSEELLPPATTTLPAVTNIDYNAKGQRTLIEYGNHATTAYEYDELTFRLMRLRTTRSSAVNGLASQLFTNPGVVQDLRYTYDPAGNIIRIADSSLTRLSSTGLADNAPCDYTYDAVYRLIEATGREHVGQTAFDFTPPFGERRDYPFLGLRAHPNDLQAMRRYIERYEYDVVGNLEVIRHAANGGGWMRGYEYDAVSLIEATKLSNRLTKTTVGDGPNFAEAYTYTDALDNDVHGCMTAINSMKMAWDFKDQLHQVDLGGGGTAYYVYDATGRRVRKVIDTQDGMRRQERIYLGGFEIYREYSGIEVAAVLERETLHVMNDKQPIALVETKTTESSNPVNAPMPVQRYQFGNHLGSAIEELDKDGGLISYEEYHPYGTTSLQVTHGAAEVSLKRYRYTGKERDEETGLYYHGARYYAPWLD